MEDIVSYFRRVTNLEPTSGQIEVMKTLLNFDDKLNIVVCGRGFGKSLICSVVALYLADVYSTEIGKPLTVLLISHQNEIYNKTDLFFRNCPDLYQRLRVKGTTLLMPQESYQFKDNGSRVLLRLDTSFQIRGNDASYVILDESQAISEDIVFKDALPSCRKDMAKFVCIGTPERATWFSDKVEHIKNKKTNDSKLWHISQYPSTVCPWLSKQIEVWKTQLTKEDYQSEVLAIVPDVRYTPPWNKKKLLKRYIEYPSTPRERPNYISVCGLDLGNTKRYKTALVIAEKNRGRKDCIVIFAENVENNWMSITERINHFHTKIVMCDSKPKEICDKIKLYVEPYCTNTKFYYVNASGRKDNMLAQMTELIHGNHITFPKPYCEMLIGQMLKYYRNKEENCDLVDALVLAVYDSTDYPLVLGPETPRGWAIANLNDKTIVGSSGSLSSKHEPPIVKMLKEIEHRRRYGK
jgi:hypothetical protein